MALIILTPEQKAELSAAVQKSADNWAETSRKVGRREFLVEYSDSDEKDAVTAIGNIFRKRYDEMIGAASALEKSANTNTLDEQDVSHLRKLLKEAREFSHLFQGLERYIIFPAMGYLSDEVLQKKGFERITGQVGNQMVTAIKDREGNLSSDGQNDEVSDVNYIGNVECFTLYALDSVVSACSRTVAHARRPS